MSSSHNRLLGINDFDFGALVVETFNVTERSALRFGDLADVALKALLLGVLNFVDELQVL
jgi:hypothetical protein